MEGFQGASNLLLCTSRGKHAYGDGLQFSVHMLRGCRGSPLVCLGERKMASSATYSVCVRPKASRVEEEGEKLGVTWGAEREKAWLQWHSARATSSDPSTSNQLRALDTFHTRLRLVIYQWAHTRANVPHSCTCTSGREPVRGISLARKDDA